MSSILKYSDLPQATYTQPAVSTSSVPLASGTGDDCDFYFHGDRFQGSPSSTYWSSQCELAAEVFGVDSFDFGSWNHGKLDRRLSSVRLF